MNPNELKPFEEITWYNVKVLDESSNPINNAVVVFDCPDGTMTKTTNDNGFTTVTLFDNITPPHIQCVISKEGFNSKTVNVIGYDSCSENDANLYTSVTLTSVPAADNPIPHHCMIYVVDNSNNSPIEGATVDVYDSVGSSTTVYRGTTDINGFYGCSYTSSNDVCGNCTYVGAMGNACPECGSTNITRAPEKTFYFNISANGYEGRLAIDHTSSSSFEAAQQNAKTIKLTRIRTADYYYVLYVKDTNNNPVQGVEVMFYIDPRRTIPYSYETMVTDENGHICILLENQTTIPSKIYAECQSIPDEYLYNGQQPLVGFISPNINTNTPGCTWTLEPVIITHYYYNIEILDKYTNMPIEGVNVDFLKNDSPVSSKNTDNEGKVSYDSTSEQRLDISIYKGGDAYEGVYTDVFLTNFEGYESLSSYLRIYLEPNYGIKVMDSSNMPAPIGTKVIITYRNSSIESKYIYGTFESGFIRTLSKSVYTSGNYYVSLMNNQDTIVHISPLNPITELLIPNKEDSTESDTPDTPDVEVMEIFDDFNEMSVGSIKEHINSGNNYLKKKYDNKYGVSNDVTYHNTSKEEIDGGLPTDVNDYRIRILDPDTINVYDIFTGKTVKMYNNQKSVIGSMDIGLKDDINELRVKGINRYSGYYNPIFKDILFYNNMSKDGVKWPFSNTSFDYEYEDNYGKFGVINNMWFHKVNDNKEIEIINTTEPYYPLIGQYALDYRDYNVFETTWDMGHYTKQVDVENSEPCQNISSMKDGLCMFGSKYLNVPDMIEISGVTLGDDSKWKGEWNDDWITHPEACPGEIMFKEVNDNSVDFYVFLKKRIIRFFQDKLKEEFEKYVEPELYSFGKVGLDDDIEEYVKKNILKLYKLEKVRLFIRRTKRGVHNSKIENDYTKYLEYDRTCESESEKTYFEKHNLVEYFRQHGFVEVNNIRLNKVNTDDFDRKVVYNLKNGYKEEFGFSFVLRKI